MQKLNQALHMSPLEREKFKQADRARLRDFERMAAKSDRAEECKATAEAKRQRRRERNLMHCS